VLYNHDIIIVLIRLSILRIFWTDLNWINYYFAVSLRHVTDIRLHSFFLKSLSYFVLYCLSCISPFFLLYLFIHLLKLSSLNHHFMRIIHASVIHSFLQLTFNFVLGQKLRSRMTQELLIITKWWKVRTWRQLVRRPKLRRRSHA